MVFIIEYLNEYKFSHGSRQREGEVVDASLDTRVNVGVEDSSLSLYSSTFSFKGGSMWVDEKRVVIESIILFHIDIGCCCLQAQKFFFISASTF